MAEVVEAQTGPVVRGWLTPLVDLLTAAVYIFLLPTLTRLFSETSTVNGLLVLAGYFVLCVSTWQLAKLKPLRPSKPVQEDDKDTIAGCLGFLSLCFGIVVVVMVIELGGVLDSGGLLEDSSTDSLIGPLFGIFIFLASLVYLFVVLLRPKPTVAAGTAGHTIRHLLGVIGVNLMFVITLAFWNSYLAEAEAVEGSVGLHILLFVVFYIIMVMFLAPPRIILNIIEGSRWGLVSFGFWLAVYCWNLTA